MAKNSILFEHTQRYVREVMADRLRENGFTSRKGEDINWYRVIDNDVIQAVYFATRHTALPSFLDIGFGSHPFFIPPLFYKGPYLHAGPGYEQYYVAVPEIIPGSYPYGMMRSQISGMSNRVYRSPDVQIMCPTDLNYGRDILDQVLLVLDRIQTPRDCYLSHKTWREREIENGSWMTMSPYFVDEVVYWDDGALLPFCKEYVFGMIEILEQAAQTGRFYRKSDELRLGELRQLREFLSNGDRDGHLNMLKEREKQVQLLLAKNTGILL